MSTYRSLARIVLALALCALTGCAWKGTSGSGSGRSGADTAAGVWEIKPVQMRVYPSSGFVREGGRLLLEARVEMLDQLGDSTKAVGQYRFELVDRDRPNEAGVGTRLRSWEVPVLSMEQNQEFYDSITRTYRFRLGLGQSPASRDTLLLMATFIPVSGRRLEAQAMLPPQTEAVPATAPHAILPLP